MHSSSHEKQARGFSLLELLVVVAIMSIMLTFAANMLRGSDKAKGVQAGVDLLKSALIQAQDIAKGRATWTRVVIPFVPEEAQSLNSLHLKYAAVMVWEPDNPMDMEMKPMGNDQEWKIDGRGYEFPSGIYLSPDLTQTKRDPNIRDSGQPMKSKVVNAKLSKAAPLPCYYIEFDRMGRMTWPRGATRIILISGVAREDGSLVPDPVDSRDKLPAQAGGLMIFPTGQMSSLKNRYQIFSDLN